MKKMDERHYVNVMEYEDERFPYQVFIGGRGTGKSYSALRGLVDCYKEKGETSIWMRRTQDESDLMCDSRTMGEAANPFSNLNADYAWSYGFIPIVKKLSGIYWRTFGEDKKPVIDGPPIGYGVALSTISSIRGISLEDNERLFYDEFIPEMHVRKMKEEGMAFLQAMETIQRNREAKGRKPMFVYLLANAYNIYNPIFVELGIVNICERMIAKGQGHRYIEERGLAIHILPPSEEFVDIKSQSALYRLTKGTRFYDINLGNQFIYNDFSQIKYINIKGYQPICSFGVAYVWKKKGAAEYYITYASAKCPAFDVTLIQDKRLFRARYGHVLQDQFVRSKVWFETYDLKQMFLDLIDIK